MRRGAGACHMRPQTGREAGPTVRAKPPRDGGAGTENRVNDGADRDDAEARLAGAVVILEIVGAGWAALRDVGLSRAGIEADTGRSREAEDGKAGQQQRHADADQAGAGVDEVGEQVPDGITDHAAEAGRQRPPSRGGESAGDRGRGDRARHP